MPPFSEPRFHHQQQQEGKKLQDAGSGRSRRRFRLHKRRPASFRFTLYYYNRGCVWFFFAIIMVIAPPAAGLLLAGIQVNGVGGVGSVVGVYLLFLLPLRIFYHYFRIFSRPQGLFLFFDFFPSGTGTHLNIYQYWFINVLLYTNSIITNSLFIW